MQEEKKKLRKYEIWNISWNSFLFLIKRNKNWQIYNRPTSISLYAMGCSMVTRSQHDHTYICWILRQVARILLSSTKPLCKLSPHLGCVQMSWVPPAVLPGRIPGMVLPQSWWDMWQLTWTEHRMASPQRRNEKPFFYRGYFFLWEKNTPWPHSVVGWCWSWLWT